MNGLRSLLFARHWPSRRLPGLLRRDRSIRSLSSLDSFALGLIGNLLCLGFSNLLRADSDLRYVDSNLRLGLLALGNISRRLFDDRRIILQKLLRRSSDFTRSVVRNLMPTCLEFVLDNNASQTHGFSVDFARSCLGLYATGH